MSKKENRDAPTAQDGLISDGLQQAMAEVEKLIGLQKADPDNKTDPVDSDVMTGLKKVRDDLQSVILDQAKDGSADARSRLILAETRAAIAEARALRAERAATTQVRVHAEPRTYTAEGENSYYRDLVKRMIGSSEKGYDEAMARLHRHAAEIAVDYREGNPYVVRALNEVHRSETPETRAISTASGSDGVFVTPQYLIDQWITYRSADRTFTNQCETLPLPAYGITFNIPSFTALGAAAQQNTENTGVNNTTPTGNDVSVTLGTFSGYIDVSQQLVDRAGFQGQGGSFDVIVIKQSQDQLYAAVDTYLQQQALTGATAVTNNGATVTIPQFYLDFATARNQLADTAGVKLPGTHLFCASDFFGWVTSQVDTNLRPLVVPDPAALAAVNDDPKWAGWTGLYMPGNYRWFTDDNTTTIVGPATQYTILVGSPLDLLVWVGDMIPFTSIQTNANTMSVLCGLRQYAAAVPRHEGAFSYITGSAYPTSLV